MNLELQCVKNSRDLGGLETYDGRKTKYGRIFRTANLSMLNSHDIELLKGYNLKRVLDFRTATVISATPNVKIDGVEYVHIPIVQELNSRVMSRDDYKTRTIADILLKFTMDFGGNGLSWMKAFYKNLYSSDYSLSQYKTFFDYLLENKQGATIFHCTAGKDRTGVGAILLLTALGVKRELIVADYLKTNESARADIEATEALAREQGVDDKIISDIAVLNGVLDEYVSDVLAFIDTFPTKEDFFREKMGIDKDYLVALQNEYLE